MRYLTKPIMVLISAALLTGCVSVTPTGGPYEKKPVATNQAKILLIRLGSTLYRDRLPAVRLDDQFVGFLPDGGFLELDTTPGTHQVTLIRHEDYARRWNFKPLTINVALAPGETKFYEMDINMTNFRTVLLVSKWDDRVTLTPVAEEQALKTLPSLNKTLITDK